MEAGESSDVQDSQGFAPLHGAAQQYSLSAAAAPLAAGALLDQENTFGNTPQQRQRSDTRWACRLIGSYYVMQFFTYVAEWLTGRERARPRPQRQLPAQY